MSSDGDRLQHSAEVVAGARAAISDLDDWTLIQWGGRHGQGRRVSTVEWTLLKLRTRRRLRDRARP